MNHMVFEKNLAALTGRFPAFAEVIREKRYELKEPLEISVETGQDETPVLCVKKEDRHLYLEGKREPGQAAKRVLERWGKLQRNAPVYIVGAGNVALIRELLEQTEDNVNIMVYEPSLSIFLTLMREVDISMYFENRPIGLVVEGINEEEMEPVIQAYLSLATVGALKQYTGRNYMELFPEKTLHFLKEVDRLSIKIVANYNTMIRFASVEADNLFHNLPYLCDGYITTQLCDVIPTDIPAIIVSAGPSLNKNIRQLHKAKNRAFIVAVDTAVRPLVKEGIIPDLYVMVDGEKPLELLDFEEAKWIPLMASITSAKKVMEHHKGKKLFYNEGRMLAYNLLAMNGIPFSSVSSGGSVACSAFSLVYKLGFSRIILVGQDLALTGNRTHADGTFQDKMEEIDTSRYRQVEGNYEEKVPIRGDLKLYLNWFNYYIAGCEGIHVMNATEGGAKIQNTEIITLEEAISRECHRKVDIAECFQRLQPILDNEKRKRAVEYLNQVPEMFRTLKKEIKKERGYYRRLEKICKSGKIDQKAYLQLLKKIKHETEKIERNELFSLISDTIAVADYMITSEQFYEEESLEKEGREIARKGIRYSELLEQCIDVLLPLAEETLGKLE